MKKLNYKALIKNGAYTLDSMVNSEGDEIVFLEHPTLGDEHPVIVAFPEYQVAFNSTFFDTFDMEAGGDYEPILVDGECKCKFETE